MRVLAPIAQNIKQLCGEFFPNDYFVFDTETTGFDPDVDLVVEWGHVIVRDRKVINRASIVINWFEHDSIPKDWLRMQLNRVRRGMQNQGKHYRFTEEVLRDEGEHPEKVIPWLYDMFEELYNQQAWLVGHNSVNFDLKMIRGHFKNDLGEELKIRPDRVIDTGCIEKASQATRDKRAMPRQGESLQEYFMRIANWKLPGVFWNVEACVKKYNLEKEFAEIDPKKLHTAGFDSYVVHILLEKFRSLLDARPAQVAGTDEPRRIQLPSQPAGTPRRRKQRNR